MTVVAQLLASALKDDGFNKVKSTWLKSVGDAVFLIEPQKSNYSNLYYLNIGVYYAAIGTGTRPCFRDAHIVNRLDAIVPKEYRDKYNKILDFDSGMIFSDRVDGLKFLVKFGLRFFEALDSLEKVKFLLSRPPHDQIHAKKSLLEFLFA